MTRERLLQFLYQTPIGIIELDRAGTIGLMNAYAARYLLPIAAGGPVTNLFDLLAPYVPGLPEEVESFGGRAGTAVGNRRFTVPFGAEGSVTLSLSIERLDEELYMATLADVTELVEQEERLSRARDEEATQRGRMEIASSVLHDIGNAVTGVSTTASRLLGEEPWLEIAELKRLEQLIATNAPGLAETIGQDRLDALTSFLQELVSKLEERREELGRAYQSMADTLGHISETLAVHRQYASEWVSGHRPRISVQQLVADALAMQQGSFEKRGVHVSVPAEGDQAVIEGDRTKLVRVFVNILKNAAEAFDGEPTGAGRDDGAPARAGDGERRVGISIDHPAAGWVRVTITDTGGGFTSIDGEYPVEEGSTTKSNSRGIGLYSAQRIVHGHGGKLSVRSAGPECGSAATVELPVTQSRAPDSATSGAHRHHEHSADSGGKSEK